MSLSLPNGSYFFMEGTPGDAIVISELTNALSAVATLPADHGVVVGDDIFLSSGWGSVDNVTARVTAVAGTAVTLGQVDTSDTDFCPAGKGIGSLRVVTDNYVQIDQNIGTTMSGGEQQYRNVPFLEADGDEQLPTGRSPRSLVINLGDDTDKPWHAALLAASKSKALRALKLQMPRGKSILYSGRISYDGIPTIQKDQEMAVVANVALKGTPLRYSAA